MKYSILCSHFEPMFDKLQNELRSIVPSNPKVLVLPFAFPIETDANNLENEWIVPQRDKYLKGLLDLGISEERVTIVNCYKCTKEQLHKLINSSNVLVIPGGNSEMLYYKLAMEFDALYLLKYFDGLIIGESAGACTQFREYFITKENNYHGYKAWYPGFGMLNDSYYIDVHTQDNEEYFQQLQKISNKRKKTIYALHDDDAIVHNRSDNTFILYGNINTFSPE